jgi:hypothetical protein
MIIAGIIKIIIFIFSSPKIKTRRNKLKERREKREERRCPLL